MAVNLSTTNLLILAALALVAGYSLVATWRTQLPWGRWRVGAMLMCRLLLLAAIAGWILDLQIHFQSANQRIELVVIADRSASISPAGRESVDQWVKRAQEKMKDRGWIKVIDLGAADAQSTPIAEAIDAARFSMPGQGERRIVLLSDGRATTHDPLDSAAELKRDGIKVFAVPAEPLAGESLIADLHIAPAAWRNVPLPIEVVISSAEAQPCKLTLTVDGEEKEHREVHVPSGASSVEMSATLETDGVHRLKVVAQFAHDRLEWNNTASALVDVPLAPRVIVISDPPAAATALASVLTTSGFLVRLNDPKDLPAKFSADCIVLANVSAKAMGESRLAAIERYVRDGGSIIFTGGAKSFAAGGYVGSALEPAFPVLLLPKKDHPPYALALIMDNSWSMNEAMTSSIGKINIAKEIAIAAMEGLHKGDLITLVSFDSDFHNIIPVTKVENLDPLRYEVARIGAFGMTNILGGMQEGARLLATMDAPYRHMILITDGKETETGTDYSRLLAQLGRDKITLTTIGVGFSPNEKLLNTLAFAGKGRYYHAKSIAEIPSAVLQEARSIDDQLTVPVALQPHKILEDPALSGIDFDTMPKLDGYNRSRARPHAWTPLVISSKNEPLLARMHYGRGQSLAFLSSSAYPWAQPWIEMKKAEYTAFWRQSVISILPPPHRPMSPRVDFDVAGRPQFDFSGSAASDSTPAITQLVGDKLTPVPSAALSAPIDSAGADAVLVTAKGRANKAFSWSRTHGKEFSDPAAGVEMLKQLCQLTGGKFAPRDDEPFAPGAAMMTREIPPSTWLLVAAVVLVIEILLRRLPALKSLVRKS